MTLRENKADSFFTTQRLNYTAAQLEALKPRVLRLRSVDDEQAAAAVDALDNTVKTLLRSLYNSLKPRVLRLRSVDDEQAAPAVDALDNTVKTLPRSLYNTLKPRVLRLRSVDDEQAAAAVDALDNTVKTLLRSPRVLRLRSVDDEQAAAAVDALDNTVKTLLRSVRLVSLTHLWLYNTLKPRVLRLRSVDDEQAAAAVDALDNTVKTLLRSLYNSLKPRVLRLRSVDDEQAAAAVDALDNTVKTLLRSVPARAAAAVGGRRAGGRGRRRARQHRQDSAALGASSLLTHLWLYNSLKPRVLRLRSVDDEQAAAAVDALDNTVKTLLRSSEAARAAAAVGGRRAGGRGRRRARQHRQDSAALGASSLLTHLWLYNTLKPRVLRLRSVDDEQAAAAVDALDNTVKTLLRSLYNTLKPRVLRLRSVDDEQAAAAVDALDNTVKTLLRSLYNTLKPRVLRLRSVDDEQAAAAVDALDNTVKTLLRSVRLVSLTHLYLKPRVLRLRSVDDEQAAAAVDALDNTVKTLLRSLYSTLKPRVLRLRSVDDEQAAAAVDALDNTVKTLLRSSEAARAAAAVGGRRAGGRGRRRARQHRQDSAALGASSLLTHLWLYNTLKPRVLRLRSVDDEQAAAAVDALDNTVKTLLRSAEFAATDCDEQIGRAAELASAASETLVAVRAQANAAKEVVDHVADLATGLELSQQPKVDSALQEAEQIKSDMEDLATGLELSQQPKVDSALQEAEQIKSDMEGEWTFSRCIYTSGKEVVDLATGLELSQQPKVDSALQEAEQIKSDMEAAAETLVAVRAQANAAKEVVDHVADLATGLELSQQPKVDSALQEAEQIKSDMEELASAASETLVAVRAQANAAKEVVDHVADLATGLELSQQLKVDSALQEAEQINSDMEDLATGLELSQQPKVDSALQEAEQIKSDMEVAKEVVDHVADLATGLELSQQPKVDSALQEAEQIKSDMEAAAETLEAVRAQANAAKEVVDHVADLATGLELSQQPKVDSALQEAEQIKSDMQGAKEVVDHVADLATGLELSQQPKVDSALQEAEQIKSSDMQAKDLSPRKEQAESAFNNATAQIERMNVFVEPVYQQAKRFEEELNRTKALNDKMDDMLKYIDLAKHKSDEADRLNYVNRKSKFGNKVASVTQLNDAAVKDLIEAALDISNATLANTLAAGVVTNSTKALDENSAVNKEMEVRLAYLSDEYPQLKIITNHALGYARALREKADNLRVHAERENNNAGTQHAYAAASAYSSIVQEIGDAKRDADTAEQLVHNATLVNEALKERVEPSRNRSVTLSRQAAELLGTVEDQLRPNLTRAEQGLQTARALLDAADDEDHAIQLAMPTPGEFSLSEAAEKADAVNATVRDAMDTMAQLGADLAAGKQWAQTLPKQADEAQRSLANLDHLLHSTTSTWTTCVSTQHHKHLAAGKQWAQTLPKQADEAQRSLANLDHLLNTLNEMSPNISRTHQDIRARQEQVDAQHREAEDNLRRVKDLIEQARTALNRLPMGVSFERQTTLQPRLPDTVDEMSTSTHVSAYFRTREPNGLILYLGNPRGTNLRRTKSDDFMVVGVQNGYPYLTMDIGDSAGSGREPAKIASDKYVADNKWYRLIVDRSVFVYTASG
ncbi:laminin G domain-containing protein [Phthorimaea operculella]|nr:laminin G domain-containing protein [Phthorimaea operculella]